jgi:hypothetical protein
MRSARCTSGDAAPSTCKGTGISAELVRIHGNDERISVEAFRRDVSDHLAIISAVVYD